MNASAIFRPLLTAATFGLLALPMSTAADDIDIFVGSSAGAAAAPNVVFLLDNTANWSRASQQWPSSTFTIGGTTYTATTQGQAEVFAIASVLSAFVPKTSFNVGFAMYVPSNVSPSGAYVRFGARDITVPATQQALQNILTEIGNNYSKEQASDGKTDEVEGFYELYKYFNSLPAYTGPATAFNLADWVNDGNQQQGNLTLFTAKGLGLQSGFALQTDGRTYSSPVTPCSNTYVIFVSNNANANTSNSLGGPGSQQYEQTSSGTPLTDINALDPFWTDEWTRFLSKNSISTFVVDVYNAQQNANFSAILKNAALVGGGKYYVANNASQLISDFGNIFDQIQAVNSSFASASLPVNATNRAQDLNQVFIGSFRPEPNGGPRWKGNLKQYQLILDSSTSTVDLGDQFQLSAILQTTGFITPCAVSFWTNDSSRVSPPSPAAAYWDGGWEQPDPASGCSSPHVPTIPALPGGLSAPDPYSDWPDGPFVEKGGAAEVLRRGNNPPATVNSPTFSVNRNLLTISGGAMTTFSAATYPGLSSSTVYGWVKGYDNDTSTITPGPEKTGDVATNVRPSIHGDVIHSRPLPLNYGGSSVSVYYGANDGVLHSVDGATGQELWGFIAPEFASKFQRLYDDSPLVSTPLTPSGISPTPQPKDYFFDGEIGAYQNADSSKVWIYPSMRRGGRTIYGLDVTSRNSPQYKWKFGCPNIGTDAGCTSGASGMGQSWSMPDVAIVKGYSTSTPVIIMGGGYDGCEDANTPTPSCTSEKGAMLYVIDADTGRIIESYSALRAVASDVALMSIHYDGTADFAYAVDTGGNIYRLDFVDSNGNALAPGSWTFHRIAYTQSGGRKFLFPPALLPVAQNTQAYLAIGSGDREHPLLSEYPFTTPVTNRFYVFLDDLTTSSRQAVNLDDTNNSDRYYLQDYTNNNCNTTTACSALQVLPGISVAGPQQIGWFINLNAGQGEQTVTSAVIVAGFVAFSTNRPIPAPVQSCSTNLGEARGYLLNLLNASGEVGTTQSIGGNRSSTFEGGGLPPSPVIFTTTINGQSDTVLIGAAQQSGGASSPLAPQIPKPPINAQRRVLFWKLNGDNQ